MQNFPEDQPVGSFTNPFAVEDDDDQEVIVLQQSEDSREGLLLRFTHGYTEE
jgi:hypothetical protein